MNEKLFELYNQDQEDRRRVDWENAQAVEKLDERDKERQEQVQEMIKKNELREGLDYHRAAMIFQHGETSEDFKTANQLAKKALELGDVTVKWLVAATEDRFLLSSGRAQKYGTQFVQNDGEWELAQPIDPTITDEERTEYNVPPLKDALRVYKEKYSIK